jgi:hypothetical protein
MGETMIRSYRTGARLRNLFRSKVIAWWLTIVCASLGLISFSSGASLAKESLQGVVAVPWGADVALIDVASGENTLLTVTGDALISMVAWAPGGSRIAASRSSRRPGDTVFGQDIDVLDPATGEVVNAITRDTDGVLLDAPTWSPDGQWIYYERQELLRHQYRIERARPDGTARTVIAESARGRRLHRMETRWYSFGSSRERASIRRRWTEAMLARLSRPIGFWRSCTRGLRPMARRLHLLP